MFSSSTSSAPPDARQPGGPEAVAAITVQRLAELDRLRNLGFQQVRRLTVVSRLLTPEQEFKLLMGPNGTVQGYERVVRAIRQIMVLEFELRGLFKAPDRDAPRKPRLLKSDRAGSQQREFETLFGDPRDYDDLNDYNDLNDRNDLKLRSDYRTGPLGEVVAGIRKTLGAEAPPNDPFAPSPQRRPVQAVTVASAPKLPTRPKIAARIQPPRRPASVGSESAQEAPAQKAATLAIRALGGKGFRIPAKSKNRGPPK
jgi:hypothetical protein